MELDDLLLLIRRRLALILILATLGLAFSVYQTSKMTPMYQATSTIFVSTPPSVSDFGQPGGNQLGELATGNNFTLARVKSYATIVNNQATLKPVIEELDLPYAIQDLSSRVSASAPTDTVLIYVKATDKDPVLAAKIANAVAFYFSETVLTIELNSSLDLTQLIKLSVVQDAEPNFSPISPRKTFNYLVGLVGGLMLALMISLFLRYLDKSIKSERDLGVTPLLGVVAFDQEAESLPLISQLGTYAARTEAFRLLRTNVLHILDEKKLNCISVTSCFSGEGKTTTSLNLGLALSQAGFNVLIIEADMRRPGLLKYLQKSDPELGSTKVGLAELLQNEKFSLKKQIPTSTLKLANRKLQVLLSGQIPNNPAELLGSERFIDLIEVAESIYDYVIVDTPPVLAVADASIVSRVTSEVLLVMHAGKTSKRNFEASRESLLGVGVAISGVLLNKIPKYKSGERYGYTYSDPKMGYYRYSYAYSPSDNTTEPNGTKSITERLANFRKVNSNETSNPKKLPQEQPSSKSEFELLLEEIKRK